MMLNVPMFAQDYGVGHWLIFVIVVAAIVYPVNRILSRLGFSAFLSLLVFIPLVNLISLWVLAFTEWPATRRAS